MNKTEKQLVRKVLEQAEIAMVQRGGSDIFLEDTKANCKMVAEAQALAAGMSVAKWKKSPHYTQVLRDAGRILACDYIMCEYVRRRILKLA